MRMMRISTMGVLMMAAAACAAGPAEQGGVGVGAENLPLGAPAASGPASAASSDVEQTLKMLEDRKGTIKNFHSNVDYKVEHIAGDVDGKSGEADFINDPKDGPQFSVNFKDDRVEGRHVKDHEQHLVFDGKKFTFIDVPGKEFRQETLPRRAGGNAGDVTDLHGSMPLPIGNKVADVLHDFDVKVVKGDGPQSTTLELVPKDATQYDYKKLRIAVDKKLQLPVKMEMENKNGEKTTIILRNVQVDVDPAPKLLPTEAPKDPGWKVDIK